MGSDLGRSDTQNPVVYPGCRDQCPEPGPEVPATLGLRGPREGARAPAEAGCRGPRAGPSEHSRVDPVAASREVLGPDRRPPTCRCSCSYRRRSRPSPVLRGASSPPLLNGGDWSARLDQSSGYVIGPGQPSTEPSMGRPLASAVVPAGLLVPPRMLGVLNEQQSNQPHFTSG